jgi:hypothetical protein
MKLTKDFVGHSYITLFGNTLSVTGYYTEKQKGRLILECSICSVDEELFPFGSIVTSTDSVNNMRCVCACNPKYKHSRKQNDLRILRRCKELNYTFQGYINQYAGVTTKLRLYNPSTGNTWGSTSLQTFLLLGVRDPQEHFSNMAASNTLPDDHFIENFMKTGSFLSGTIFYRISTTRWRYTCPLCSKDEYVMNKLCDGYFESSAGHLSSGRKSCRCSGKYRWSKSQRNYQLKKFMVGLNWKVLGWEDGVSSKNSKVVWECDKGHENKTLFSNLVKRISCRQCSGNGFNNSKPASLYLVRWVCHETKYSCIKYGITNKAVSSRVTSQKSKTKLIPTLLYAFFGEGIDVECCERSIKNLVGGNYCSKEILPRGFSETAEDSPESLKSMLELISSYGLKEVEKGLM